MTGVEAEAVVQVPELELVAGEEAYCLAAATAVDSVQEASQVMEEQLTPEVAVEAERRSC